MAKAFPIPKRGTKRMVRKLPMKTTSRSTSTTKYVRISHSGQNRRVRAQWEMNIKKILETNAKELTKSFVGNLLEDRSHTVCPHCELGQLGSLTYCT